MNAERADRFEARAKRQALRVIRKVVGFALFLGVCMWGFIGWSLWSEYNLARSAGQTEGYNLTAAFASELSMTFDSVGAAFRFIESEIEAHPPGAGADMENLRRSITAIAGPGTEVRIAGPDGHLLFSSVQADAGLTDFSQQPHFMSHQANPSLQFNLDPLRP
jgi:hypothetical protein